MTKKILMTTVATHEAFLPAPRIPSSVFEKRDMAPKKLSELIRLAKLHDAKFPGYPPLLEVIRETVKHAPRGNREEQHNAGKFYYSGEYGIPQDFELALYWFIEAAMRGHSASILQVAKMLEEGQGTQMDKILAVQWYKLLLPGENPIALRSLAMIYKEGEGVPQDDDIAYGYMFRAATHGDALAAYYLGNWLSEGSGAIKVDLAQAMYWYGKAADKGNSNALNNLGVIKAKLAYETWLVDANAQPYVDEAIGLFKKGARQGNGLAAYNLAQFYRLGCGEEQNDKKALEYLTIAAERGVEQAAVMRREMNSNGKRKADDSDISRSPSPPPKIASVGSAGPP